MFNFYLNQVVAAQFRASNGTTWAVNHLPLALEAQVQKRIILYEFLVGKVTPQYPYAPEYFRTTLRIVISPMGHTYLSSMELGGGAVGCNVM
jgi:hypothetical protein